MPAKPASVAEKSPSFAAPSDAACGPAQALAEAAQVVARLRAPGGCAWDREQTAASLVPYLLEEAAEAAAEARAGNAQALCDELGDVLLQVLLQSEIAAEAGSFTLADVAHNLTDKLIRRHPHVFGEKPAANSAAQAEANWEAAKARERQNPAAQGPPQGALGGVPRHLPALQRAQKVAKKAAKVGFDWPDVQGPFAKLAEEVAEIKQALAARETLPATASTAQRAAAQAALADEVGDALFSLVNLARHLKVDAEETLHQTLGRFGARFAEVEALLAAQGHKAADQDLDVLQRMWQLAKQNLAPK